MGKVEIRNKTWMTGDVHMYNYLFNAQNVGSVCLITTYLRLHFVRLHIEPGCIQTCGLLMNIIRGFQQK